MHKILPLLVLFLALIAKGLSAQQVIDQFSPPPGKICVLPLNAVSEPLFVPPPPEAEQRFLLTPASIQINFLTAGQTLYGYTCSTWPAQAQTAAQYASNIWAAGLTSGQTITVDACWSTGLGGSTLGSAGPSDFYLLDNAPHWTDTWFPVALTEALFDADLNGGSAEGNAIFNANRTDWYYGTDGQTPFNKVDFATTFLHELGHALGFLGVMAIDNGSGSPECDGIAGEGCYGFWGDPTIFTRFVELGDGSSLLDLENPSTDLATLVTGGSVGGATGLYSGSELVEASNGGLPAKLYTPGTFSSGSSFSHWDQNAFSSQLMKPLLSYGQAIHNPGLALQSLRDMGWNGQVPLPVTLSDWFLRPAGNRVELHWATSAETHNLGFSIQRSRNGVHWETIGWLPGKGNSTTLQVYRFDDPEPYRGQNFYRLEQQDVDGKRLYSPILAARVSAGGFEIQVGPNPVSEDLRIRLPDDFEGRLELEIMDLAGRRVYSGSIDGADETVDIRFLPDGMYHLKGHSESSGEMITFVLCKMSD